MNLLFAALLGLAVGRARAAAPAPAYVPEEALVLFHAAPSRPALAAEAGRLGAKAQDAASLRRALHSNLGATLVREIPFIQADHVRLPPGLAVEAAVAAYRASPLVRGAEPNWLAKAVSCALPSDPLLIGGFQPGLGRTSWQAANAAWCSGQVLLQAVVKVAVIDTGVDPHPDLAPQLLAGANFFDGSAGNDDDNGHGTFVAGLIAAGTDNAVGMAGAFFAASLVRILPVKVLGANGTGGVGGIAAGIGWAAGQGARVLNLSLQSPVNSETLEAAVNEARNKGVFIAAAAGNDSTETAYPAAYANAFSVAALASDDTAAFYSNSGKIELAAPGGDGDTSCVCSASPAAGTCATEVWSLCKDTAQYQAAAGTSFASPLVAAAAALLLSQDPARRVEDLSLILTQSADPAAYGPGWHRETGWGRLNFHRALSYGRGAASGSVPAMKAYNWPNPFNPTREGVTQLTFYLSRPGAVAMRLLDAGGAIVWEKSFSSSATYAGMNQVTWDGRSAAGNLVSNGAYTWVLEAEGSRTVSMVAVLR